MINTGTNRSNRIFDERKWDEVDSNHGQTTRISELQKRCKCRKMKTVYLILGIINNFSNELRGPGTKSNEIGR